MFVHLSLVHYVNVFVCGCPMGLFLRFDVCVVVKCASLADVLYIIVRVLCLCSYVACIVVMCLVCGCPVWLLL